VITAYSSSLELAPAYNAAKAAQEKATEASTSNYTKKRGMLTEVKHFKEQKEEVKQWERLRDEKVSDARAGLTTG
jgi:structural maintenance of chromosome 1